MYAHVTRAVAAGVFLRTFYKCMSEGVIVRSSALAMMCVYYDFKKSYRFKLTWRPCLLCTRRVWRTWSIASGSDVTWGVLDKIAEAVHIAPWELEAPEAAFLDLSEGERCVLAFRW